LESNEEVRKYLSFFKSSLKNEFAYKADFILSMLVNSVFFFIYYAVWQAVYKNSGITEINSFTLSTTITYYLITSLIFRIDVSDFVFMGWSVWSGEFTNDLIKPWSPKIIHALWPISDVIISFLLYLPVMFVIYVFTSQYIQLPSALNLVYFLIALGFSVIFSLVINLGLHSLVFFFGDQDSNIGLVNYVIAFAAGAFFPLAFLPHTLNKIFLALPFKYIFDVPVNIYLGRLSSADIFKGWLSLVVWIVIFYALFCMLYSKGLKRYTGTGR